MSRLFLAVVLVTIGAQTVRASPAADALVVWAPDADLAPLVAVARDLGIGLIDRTPAKAPAPVTAAALATGIAAYDELRFDDAWIALERARDLADRDGAEGLASAQLSDLFLYRALVQSQRRPDAMWDELVAAAIVDPTRALDRARFAPTVIEQFERARTQVAARPRASITIAGETCRGTLDGHAYAGTPEAIGPHWLVVHCRDHRTWGARIDLVEGGITATPRGALLVPPTAIEIAAIARDASARAAIGVEVRGSFAIVRLVDATGTERDRRTVTLAGDLRPAADAVRAIAAPAPPVLVAREHWYRSPWVLVVGAALVGAAIAIPITAHYAGDDGASGSLHWTGVLP